MNKKSVAKNYIYNLIYQMLTIIIPLITIPYLSKVLGSNGIGIYSYTLSIATYFVLFGSLGVLMYGQREIAYVRDDRNKRSCAFWEILILKLITMIVSLIVFYITFVNGTQYQIYYKILMIELLANIIDISWFFQGLEEFKKTVSRNILVKIVSLILIFILVKKPEDLWIYMLIYVVANLLGNMSLWLYLPNYLVKVDLNKININKHIIPVLNLFVPQIAMQVYLVLDKTMIGSITGDMSSVGNYEQSQKIVKTALMIVTSLGTVVAPRIANIISTGNKKEVSDYLKISYKFVWLLGFPIMLGMIAVSKTIVPWFLGAGYEESVRLIMIGSLLIMAIGLNNVTGIQYLIPAKKQNKYTKSVVCAAIFNFIFNLILIPKFKATGAIISSVLAEFLIVIIQLIDVKNDFDIKIIIKGMWKYIVSGIAMFIPTIIIGIFLDSNIKTTFIQVITGSIIYLLLLLILKDEFIYKYIKILKEKLFSRKEEDNV